MWAGSVAPDGWYLCNGDVVAQTTFSALFDVIGTMYGFGLSTYGLPNLQGIYPRGFGTQTISSRSKGQAAVLGLTTEDAMQSHKHTTTAGGTHEHILTDPGHTHNIWGTGVGAAAARLAIVTDHYNDNLPGLIATSTTMPTVAAATHTHPVGEFADAPTDDLTNGTPRTGLTTEPSCLNINFIIKL